MFKFEKRVTIIWLLESLGGFIMTIKLFHILQKSMIESGRLKTTRMPRYWVPSKAYDVIGPTVISRYRAVCETVYTMFGPKLSTWSQNHIETQVQDKWIVCIALQFFIYIQYNMNIDSPHLTLKKHSFLFMIAFYQFTRPAEN